jgi:demethylmenaquinone methyltransferase/2-methoxy-6-polyprenyl-1,4-benzoquinol methylase
MSGISKKQQVGEMFDAIAPTYDGLNHFLSLGIDRGWRKRAVKMVAAFLRSRDSSPLPSPSSPFRLLDVATGTGDMVIELARRIPSASITGADISENMLAVGREKVERAGLSARVVLQTGDAEALDFPDGAFDGVTVAFGVRNFGDIPAGLGEMRRVLRSGGRCYVLEFSEPRAPIFGWVYRFYFHRVLPWFGRMVSKDRAAYTYLPQSVDAFPSPERFSEMLREAGFSSVSTKKLTFGVAFIYEAVK